MTNAPRWLKIVLVLFGAIPTVFAAFSGLIESIEGAARTRAINDELSSHVEDLQINVKALLVKAALVDKCAADSDQAKLEIKLMREHMEGYLKGLNARQGSQGRHVLQAEIDSLRAKIRSRAKEEDTARSLKYAPPSNLPALRKPRAYEDVIEQTSKK